MRYYKCSPLTIKRNHLVAKTLCCSRSVHPSAHVDLTPKKRAVPSSHFMAFGTVHSTWLRLYAIDQRSVMVDSDPVIGSEAGQQRPEGVVVSLAVIRVVILMNAELDLSG